MKPCGLSSPHRRSSGRRPAPGGVRVRISGRDRASSRAEGGGRTGSASRSCRAECLGSMARSEYSHAADRAFGSARRNAPCDLGGMVLGPTCPFPRRLLPTWTRGTGLHSSVASDRALSVTRTTLCSEMTRIDWRTSVATSGSPGRGLGRVGIPDTQLPVKANHRCREGASR